MDKPIGEQAKTIDGLVFFKNFIFDRIKKPFKLKGLIPFTAA
jgi:hypothetical protein